MAQRQVVLLEDDIEGGEATQTVRFTYDGVEYEIDLNDDNADKLRDAFGTYANHARRVGGRQASARNGRRASTDGRAVREWAASNGITLSPRGRIPSSVMEQYRAAGN